MRIKDYLSYEIHEDARATVIFYPLWAGLRGGGDFKITRECSDFFCLFAYPWITVQFSFVFHSR